MSYQCRPEFFRSSSTEILDQDFSSGSSTNFTDNSENFSKFFHTENMSYQCSPEIFRSSSTEISDHEISSGSSTNFTENCEKNSKFVYEENISYQEISENTDSGCNCSIQ